MLKDSAHMVVHTSSGGYHLYYLYDKRFDGIGKAVGIYGWIDFLVDNACALGPGSVIKGKSYVLEKKEAPGYMSDEVFNI